MKILKTLYQYTPILFLWPTLSSCQKKEMATNDKQQNLHQAELTASIADGLYNRWKIGDAIMLIHNGKDLTVKTKEAGSTSKLSASIEETFTNDNPLYGVYPAESMLTYNRESVSVAVSENQTAEDSGSDSKATISVASTVSKNLTFYTITGGIKLNFKMSGITKVVLESVDGYPLAGKATIKWDNQGKPLVDKVENAKSILTFTAPNSSTFAPNKDYYISTLPCNLYGGYRLSIYKDGLVAHYFSVHQTVVRADYITPTDLDESNLEFDSPKAPLVEEARPTLDATTTALVRQYRQNPTEENKQALLNQMGFRYDKVVARKKAKLRELEREAKTTNLITQMQGIVNEMVENRDVRLQQQFLRLIDPRSDDNPNDAWMVLRGSTAPNAYISYAPVTNAEYALFKKDFSYPKGTDNYPVVNISIAQASAYCNWLSERDKSHLYRLPTDEEWILAAGHMPKDIVMNAGRITNGLTPVDAYQQTKGACGGIDFWGNAWEWTISTDTNGNYIIKGGSWDSSRDDCRTEKSDITRKGTQGYSNVGFRIVRQ